MNEEGVDEAMRLLIATAKNRLRDGLSIDKVQEMFYFSYLLLVHLIRLNKDGKKVVGFTKSQLIGCVVSRFVSALFLYLRDRVMKSAIGTTVRKMLNVMVPWSILPFQSGLANMIFLLTGFYALNWLFSK